jgi:hypothetical protein
VRREASYWLVRLAEAGAGGATRDPVVAELQRLRFGASSTWREPEKTFRGARRALRELRRRSKVVS